MQLLKIEWLKLKTYRTFWFIVILYVVLFVIWNIGANNVTRDLNSGTIRVSSETYSFPYVWNIIAFVYRWFILFLCMFVIVSVCNEYTFKTQRQHIIDGMHRLDFLHAKSLMILSGTILFTLFFVLNCFIFGWINGGQDPLAQAHIALYVFVFTLNYLSLAALLALLLKRTGLTIMLFFAYLMLESGVTNLVNLKLDTFAGNLLPTQCSDELLPLRSWNRIRNMAGSTFDNSNAPEWVYLAVSLLYIALYYFLARRKMLRSDL